MEAKGVNGQVSFDGATVVIRREGLMARASHGRGDKRIPLRSITAIQWVPPKLLSRGFVSFTFAGANEGTAAKGRRTLEAANDENSVIVARGQAEEFGALVDAIESAMAAL